MTASFKAVMIGGVRWYQQQSRQTHRLVASIIQRARIMPLRALERYGAFKGECSPC